MMQINMRPITTGSDKQIEWATSLKHQAISTIQNAIDLIHQKAPDQTAAIEAATRSMERIDEITDAKFFIDHRNFKFKNAGILNLALANAREVVLALEVYDK